MPSRTRELKAKSTGKDVEKKRPWLFHVKGKMLKITLEQAMKA